MGRIAGRSWLRPEFDPVFEDGPTLVWLRMNVDAFRRFRRVNVRDLVHVGLFAFSRGGSHLVESQFHLARSCFCFGEGALDFRSDINWRTFLCRGMFRTDSIQDKSGDQLTHLFYNCNNSPAHLGKDYWLPGEFTEYRRKWVLILRNPLRLLLSRHATGKHKWKLDENSTAAFLDWFDSALSTFRDLRERRPEDTVVISVEQFAAAPEPSLHNIAQHLGIDQKWIAERPTPMEFFQRLSRTGERPTLEGGHLSSRKKDIVVMGWGGAFNPMHAIDADRLYNHDLACSLPRNILDLLRARIGARALDFYLSDRDHRFAAVDPYDLLRL